MKKSATSHIFVKGWKKNWIFILKLIMKPTLHIQLRQKLTVTICPRDDGPTYPIIITTMILTSHFHISIFNYFYFFITTYTKKKKDMCGEKMWYKIYKGPWNQIKPPNENNPTVSKISKDMYGHTLDYLTNTCPYLNANFHCYDYFFCIIKIKFFRFLNFWM